MTGFRNILISSAGRRVALLRAFGSELQKSFPGAKVIAADCKPELSPACREADGFFSFPRNSDPSFIPRLLEICRSEEVGLLIPTIDTELLALSQHVEEFDEIGTKVIVPSHPLVAICRDKRRTHQFFSDHDIPVPEIYQRRQIRYPAFVKPVDGSCSKNTFLVRDENALLAMEAHIGDTSKLLYLEAIPRTDFDEYTVDMYYDRSSRLQCVVPRKRIEVRAGEVSKGVTVRNEIVPFLRERLEYIDGAIGCLTLQLFKHKAENAFYGIEINPRFGGGYPLSYRAGANFPGWLIAEYFQGADIGYFDDWEEDLLFLRYDDEILVHGFQR